VLTNRPILKISLIILTLVFLLCGTILLSSWLVSGRQIYVQNNSGIDGKPVNNISVTAEGKVSVIPDIAVFTAGYTVQKNTVADVQSDLNDKSNSIKKALKDQGLEDKDITTSQFNISPNYRYDNGRSTIDGHNGSFRMTIKVRKIQNTGSIIDKTVQAGANTVDSVSFTVDNIEKAKSDARAAAAKLAKQKADELAKNSDKELGGLIAMTEIDSPTTPPVAYYNKALTVSADSISAPTEIASGSLEVLVTVEATYGIK